MGSPDQTTSSFSFNLRIVKARNIELHRRHRKTLFIRCYLSAGNSQKVELNSKEISSNLDLFWNESFSLNCQGNEDTINSMSQGNIIFELRCRSNLPVLGSICGSELLGRAQIPWKAIFESPGMEIETWVTMIPKSKRVNEDVKPPAVQIVMKVDIGDNQIRKKKKHDKRINESECCMDCGGCDYVDYDMLALGILVL